METLERSATPTQMRDLHHALPPRLGDLSGRGGGNIVRAKGDGWLRGNSLLLLLLLLFCFVFSDTTGWMHLWTHRACNSTQDLHRFKPDTIPALRRGSGHDTSLLTKKRSATDIWYKRGEIHSLQWSVTESIYVFDVCTFCFSHFFLYYWSLFVFTLAS